MRFNSLHSLISAFGIILLIALPVTIALAEEQADQECGFSIKDDKGRMYEVYIPESKTLMFETADESITVEFGRISLLQIIKDDEEKIKVNITLKDGKELTELYPVDSKFYITGKLFIAGMFVDISNDISWGLLSEIKSLDKQKPSESQEWSSLKPKSEYYPKIQFRNSRFMIPFKNKFAYEEEKYDSGLYILRSVFPLFTNQNSHSIQVNRYQARNFNDVFVNNGPLEFALPIERIYKYSQSEKTIILKNSQSMIFDSIETPQNLIRLYANTRIGACIFSLNDIECLEFADTKPIG